MIERKKIWLGISAALMAGNAAQVSADAIESPGELSGRVDAAYQSSGSAIQTGGAGDGDGESQGEGEAGVPDLAADDVAFLKRLGLIRGHLYVGQKLYREGRVDMARTHIKHPRDELYAGLVPAINARGASSFDQALSGLAEALESDAGIEAVETAWETLDESIREIETSVDATTAQQLLAVARMSRTAAEEYAIGVVNGRLDNAHEYQDAWGFVQVARLRLDRLSGANDDEIRAIERAGKALADLNRLWPGLAPEGMVDGDASLLHGAAARIELAARSLPF